MLRVTVCLLTKTVERGITGASGGLSSPSVRYVALLFLRTVGRAPANIMANSLSDGNPLIRFHLQTEMGFYELDVMTPSPNRPHSGLGLTVLFAFVCSTNSNSNAFHSLWRV